MLSWQRELLVGWQFCFVRFAGKWIKKGCVGKWCFCNECKKGVIGHLSEVSKNNADDSAKYNNKNKKMEKLRAKK